MARYVALCVSTHMAKSETVKEVKKSDKTEVSREQIHGWFIKGYKASRTAILSSVQAVAVAFEKATKGLPEEVKAFAFAARTAVSLKTLAAYCREVGVLDEKDKAPETMTGLITLMFKTSDSIRRRSIAQSLAFAADDYAKAHNLKAPSLSTRVKKTRNLTVGIRGLGGKAGYTVADNTNPEALGAIVKWLGGEVGAVLVLTETGPVNLSEKNVADPMVFNILYDRLGMAGINTMGKAAQGFGERRKDALAPIRIGAK